VPCQLCRGGIEKLISKKLISNEHEQDCQSQCHNLSCCHLAVKRLCVMRTQQVTQVACVCVLSTLTCTITALLPETRVPPHIPRINSRFPKKL